jgi:hypothetical protein
MSNLNGSIYGLTILSPIREDVDAELPHSIAIRAYLAGLSKGQDSPFDKLSGTHMARLAILDDIPSVGWPTVEDHLKTQYLIFESNFDGDLDSYLNRMGREIPAFVHSIWEHCVGYPGVQNMPAFVNYMKRCQVETTYYFADVNDKTVTEILRALRTKELVAGFIERNQGKQGVELRQALADFVKTIEPLGTSDLEVLKP